METKIQFQKNAKVLAADGQQVGTLERVVLNPETRVVTHIVVHRAAFLKRDSRVVPIYLVAGTDMDQILLLWAAGDLESLPPFEETHLVDREGSVDNPSPIVKTPAVDTQTSIYGYPGLGVSVGPAPGEKFVTQIEQNIPEGTVALKEGARVITAEGRSVGKVERILADVPAERATHLLVSMGMFTRDWKLVPMTWVDAIHESEVYLRVKEDALREITAAPMAG
jgi:sporulation protein YlmC with PRC-barrel domain